MSNGAVTAIALLIGFGGPLAYGFWLMWKHRNDTAMPGKE